jgi:hypothetical protein
VPIAVGDALSFFPVRTDGTAKALLIAELYPSLDQPPPLRIGTEALHITDADGTKSLRQLIEEQSLGTPFGDRPLSSIQFVVDSAGGPLTFTEGFELTIDPGQSKKFEIPVTSKPAMDTLEDYKVRSDGPATNVLIIVELPDPDPKCKLK